MIQVPTCWTAEPPRRSSEAGSELTDARGVGSISMPGNVIVLDAAEALDAGGATGFASRAARHARNARVMVESEPRLIFSWASRGRTPCSKSFSNRATSRSLNRRGPPASPGRRAAMPPSSYSRRSCRSRSDETSKASASLPRWHFGSSESCTRMALRSSCSPSSNEPINVPPTKTSDVEPRRTTLPREENHWVNGNASTSENGRPSDFAIAALAACNHKLMVALEAEVVTANDV
jgi:hypothetical protein